MLRRFLAALAVSVAFAAPAFADPMDTGDASSGTGTVHHARYGSTATKAAPSNQYADESAAQAHCPADTVVWLNLHSGIWHLKGERWYGHTKHGAYVCEKEAAAAGDRETHNGQ